MNFRYHLGKILLIRGLRMAACLGETRHRPEHILYRRCNYRDGMGLELRYRDYAVGVEDVAAYRYPVDKTRCCKFYQFDIFFFGDLPHHGFFKYLFYVTAVTSRRIPYPDPSARFFYEPRHCPDDLRMSIYRLS